EERRLVLGAEDHALAGRHARILQPSGGVSRPLLQSGVRQRLATMDDRRPRPVPLKAGSQKLGEDHLECGEDRRFLFFFSWGTQKTKGNGAILAALQRVAARCDSTARAAQENNTFLDAVDV